MPCAQVEARQIGAFPFHTLLCIEAEGREVISKCADIGDGPCERKVVGRDATKLSAALERCRVKGFEVLAPVWYGLCQRSKIFLMV